MKLFKIKFLLTLCMFLFMHFGSDCQIARGAYPGEIFINCFWYNGPPSPYHHYGVFYSTDNGATLSPQFTKFSQSLLYGDSLPGNIYLAYGPFIYRSQNYGVTWDTINTSFFTEFASGCVPGDVYKHSSYVADPELQRSSDFGFTFQTVDSAFGSDVLLDVGTIPGEVYGYRRDSNWDTLELKYSHDYGNTFSSIIIDTSIIPPSAFIGKPAILSRGTVPNEFYFIRMDTMARYRIYHTFDNGQTFEYNYITQPCYECAMGGNDIMFTFTGGREPGSFYIARAILDTVIQDHTILCIDYSQDYGKTYITFCHDLDSTFTGINNNPAVAENFMEQNYPNPFYDKTQIGFNLDKISYAEITVADLFGNVVKTLVSGEFSAGKHQVIWDGTNKQGTRVAPGVYMYQVKLKGTVAGTKKAIVY